MAIKQQQKLKQQQRISPQQLLAIRMLELPALEIEESIKQELDENPVLEEGIDYADDQGADFESDDNNVETGNVNEDLSLGDYINEDDIPDYKLAEMNSREERKETTPYNNQQSLSEYLLYQLELSELSEKEKKIGEYIIGNIDNDGYLRRNLNLISDDIAFQTGEDIGNKELFGMLNFIQQFDPPGVGAQNLRECLLLQLKKRHNTPEVILAKTILTDFFEEFSRKHFTKIQKVFPVSNKQLKEVIHLVTSLNPKPGSNWDDSMTTIMNRVIPDFVVETLNEDITLTLNNRGIPDLRINREYSNMLKDYTGNVTNQTPDKRDAVLFIKQKIDAAQGFIDAVRQRQEVLQRTMNVIMHIQQEFFITGDESKLKPMILKDVAVKTGFDISTISRVSNSKYVQTNFGVYPLKFFFSESTQTESGETISTRKIKQIIKEEIDAEDKKKPVTDEELTVVLKAKGFLIARRTVAKYREQLGIPVARLRKEID
jgi:RNA polymerase sigma-54 factor